MTRLAWHLGPLMAAVAALFAIYYVDTTYFPVIPNFSVTSIIDNGDKGVVIEGVMRKERDCKVVEITAYGDTSRITDVTFLDRPDGVGLKSRSVRVQFWGPWRVDSKGYKKITLFARHSCYFLWDHTARLASFQVNPIEYQAIPTDRKLAIPPRAP